MAKTISAEEFSKGGKVRKVSGDKFFANRQSQEQVANPFGGVVGASKSLGETGLGLGTIGRGIQKAVSSGERLLTGQNRAFRTGDESIFDPGSQQRQAVQQALEAKTPQEEVGKFLGTATQFLVPGSRAARAEGFLRRVAGSGAGDFGVASARELGQQDKIGSQALTEGAIGAAFPVAGAATRGVRDFSGRFIKGLAGTLSGTKNEVLDTIIERPREALRTLNKEENEAAREIATDIANNVKKLERETNRRFGELIEQASNRKVPTNQSVIDAQTGETLPSLKESVMDTLSSFNINLDEAGKVNFRGSRLQGTSEQNTVRDLVRQINELGDEATPREINDLATNIQNLRKGPTSGENVNPVIDAVRRNVREVAEVADETGAITRANDFFNQRQDLLNTFLPIVRIKENQGALRSGEVPQRRLREVASSLRQFFSESKPLDRDIIEEFERLTNQDILGRAAGFRSGSPAGEAGGSVGLALGAAALPPRTIGRGFANASIARQNLEEAAKATNMPESMRAAIQALIDRESNQTGGE